MFTRAPRTLEAFVIAGRNARRCVREAPQHWEPGGWATRPRRSSYQGFGTSQDGE